MLYFTTPLLQHKSKCEKSSDACYHTRWNHLAHIVRIHKYWVFLSDNWRCLTFCTNSKSIRPSWTYGNNVLLLLKTMRRLLFVTSCIYELVNINWSNLWNSIESESIAFNRHDYEYKIDSITWPEMLNY